MKKILLLILTILVSNSVTHSSELYSTPKVVTDIELIKVLIATDSTETDSALLKTYGTFHIVFTNDSTSRILLLHNGTEIRRVDSASTTAILNEYPYIKMNSSSTSEYSTDSITDGKHGSTKMSDTRPFEQKVLSLGQWDDKIEFNQTFHSINAGTYYTQLKSDLQIHNHYKYFYYGAGLSITSFYGSLNDTIVAKYPNYGGAFGFKLSVGAPFLKYTLKNSGEKIPEYAWLGNSIYTLFIYEEENSFFNIYKDGLDENQVWNMEHQFNLKIWNFYYDLIIDGDVYQNPIHIISFQDLRTFFGTWDLKVIKSPTVWIPGFRFTTKEIHLKDFKYKKMKLPLSTSIIYADVYYKNTSQFNIGAGIKFKLEIENGEK